jgi:hypothetical protein
MSREAAKCSKKRKYDETYVSFIFSCVENKGACYVHFTLYAGKYHSLVLWRHLETNLSAYKNRCMFIFY